MAPRGRSLQAAPRGFPAAPLGELPALGRGWNAEAGAPQGARHLSPKNQPLEAPRAVPASYSPSVGPGPSPDPHTHPSIKNEDKSQKSRV